MARKFDAEGYDEDDFDADAFIFAAELLTEHTHQMSLIGGMNGTTEDEDMAHYEAMLLDNYTQIKAANDQRRETEAKTKAISSQAILDNLSRLSMHRQVA